MNNSMLAVTVGTLLGATIVFLLGMRSAKNGRRSTGEIALIDKIEMTLSLVPAKQPNCEICDAAIKLIEDWRESRGDYGGTGAPPKEG